MTARYTAGQKRRLAVLLSQHDAFTAVGGSRKETSMRTADCPLCGQHLEAENDDELFKKGRAHADEKHADQNITDEQIRQVPTSEA
jgi:predicted small metal-binding protein